MEQILFSLVLFVFHVWIFFVGCAHFLVAGVALHSGHKVIVIV